MAELTPAAKEPAVTLNAERRASRGWDIFCVASLLCGVFLIVPFLAGLGAITLAFLGLRQSARLNLRGRRLAVAGLILGLVNIFGWTVYFRFISQVSRPGREIAHQFIGDLSGADPSIAARDCDGVSSDKLAAGANQLKSWGGVRSVTVLHITSQTTNSLTTSTVSGEVTSPGGGHSFRLETLTEINDLWKVRDFSLQ